MNRLLLRTSLTALLALGLTACATDTHRQADVARRGAEVMPFSLQATTHIFIKTADGGRQRVVAKRATDEQQTQSIRQHLQEIKTQFEQGDFAAPSHIHGDAMPGLARLKAAKPGEIWITYEDVISGGQLQYRTSNAELVAALHAWFDAQLSDHGSDAMSGHEQHHLDHHQHDHQDQSKQ
jgi:hypothetical protein